MTGLTSTAPSAPTAAAKVSIGVIVGATVGSLIVAGLTTALLFVIFKSKPTSSRSKETQPGQPMEDIMRGGVNPDGSAAPVMASTLAFNVDSQVLQHIQSWK